MESSHRASHSERCHVACSASSFPTRQGSVHPPGTHRSALWTSTFSSAKQEYVCLCVHAHVGAHTRGGPAWGYNSCEVLTPGGTCHVQRSITVTVPTDVCLSLRGPRRGRAHAHLPPGDEVGWEGPDCILRGADGEQRDPEPAPQVRPPPGAIQKPTFSCLRTITCQKLPSGEVT